MIIYYAAIIVASVLISYWTAKMTAQEEMDKKK